MALILRKAVLPKNMSLLKCMKGRPVATTSNKKNTAPLLHNAMKRNLAKRTQKAISCPASKTKDIKFHKEMIEFNGQPSKSVSCPSFKHLGSTGQNLTLRRTASISHIKEHKAFFQKCRLLQNYVENNVLQIRAASTNATEKSVNAVKNIGSVCACPVPSSCLPPPCNTPAKCLQYMTGYYYYPYGTWFCGPYHVSTGSCPCAGPVKPGGSCGPVLPCPGDPCGPICCKPLSCCGVCGVGGPFQNSTTNNAYNPWQFGSTNMYSSYNLYPPIPYMEYNSYYPYNPYTPSGYYNGYNGTPPNFGQCYNVPISPIPVTHPMTSESCQTNTESSAPKSSICWPLSKANINQDTKVFSSNITPKPMRFSPSSSYDSKPAVSKTNPYTKPRINARTLQQSNSIGICYFSTKCIEKYANKGKIISTYNLQHGIGPRKLSRVTRTVTEEAKVLKHNSFNYWSLLSDGNKRQE